MSPIRKRAKGGGRKPIGTKAKSSNFSTRITANTRSALEVEAKLADISVSRMAEQLLELGLDTKREREQRSPIKALSYIVEYLADECSVATHDSSPPFEWNTDTFVFDALTRALGLLLERLRPSDSPLQKYLAEAKNVHPVYRELLATPETWAKHAFWNLWDELAGYAAPAAT
jgi:hypothetical protein